jgi:hypothetical protein
LDRILALQNLNKNTLILALYIGKIAFLGIHRQPKRNKKKKKKSSLATGKKIGYLYQHEERMTKIIAIQRNGKGKGDGQKTNQICSFLLFFALLC